MSIFFFFCFFQLTISLWVVHFSYNSAILRRRQTLLQRFSRKHTQPDVPKGSPLWIFFGILRLKKYFFEKNFKNNFFEKFFFPNFYNSCSLNIFEPKIWRRLGTFPSCFFFSLQSHSEWSTFYNLFICSVVHLRLNFWSRRAGVRFSH